MSWSAVSWEVARAGGLTSFALLSAAVIVGLVVSLRATSPRWPRFVTTELHNFLTLLALAFVAIHVGAVVLDPFVRLGLADVLVPFATGYRTLWMALGIVSLDLGLAIGLSTLLRRRIGYARWRRLHTLTLAVYALALAHGLAMGTDTGQWWVAMLYAASAVAVGALVRERMARSAASGRDRAARPGPAVADGAAAVGPRPARSQRRAR